MFTSCVHSCVEYCLSGIRIFSLYQNIFSRYFFCAKRRSSIKSQQKKTTGAPLLFCFRTTPAACECGLITCTGWKEIFSTRYRSAEVCACVCICVCLIVLYASSMNISFSYVVDLVYFLSRKSEKYLLTQSISWIQNTRKRRICSLSLNSLLSSDEFKLFLPKTHCHFLSSYLGQFCTLPYQCRR